MTTVSILIQSWVPKEFFEERYVPLITEAFENGYNINVAATRTKTDFMVQTLLQILCCLSKKEESFRRITVFDLLDRDGRLDKRFQLSNIYRSMEELSTIMAIGSDETVLCAIPWGTELLIPMLITYLATNENSKSLGQCECVALAHDIANLINSKSDHCGTEIIYDDIVPWYKNMCAKSDNAPPKK